MFIVICYRSNRKRIQSLCDNLKNDYCITIWFFIFSISWLRLFIFSFKNVHTCNTFMRLALMSFLDNSSICAISALVSVDFFFPTWVEISYFFFFTCQVILDCIWTCDVMLWDYGSCLNPMEKVDNFVSAGNWPGLVHVMRSAQPTMDCIFHISSLFTSCCSAIQICYIYAPQWSVCTLVMVCPLQ